MADAPTEFPELIPDAYRELADSSGLSGPLHLAVRESQEEYEEDPHALADPIGEEHLKPLPYLVRKYADRALYLATPRCLVHCRFCFRRTLLPTVEAPTPDDLEAVVRWLWANPEVKEVILSGGDPLALGNDHLAHLLTRIGSVDSVERLRIHTRAPVVYPGRVTPALATVLGESPKPTTVVLHVAHQLELTSEVEGVIDLLNSCAADVMAQTVLLRGINAEPTTLAALFTTLKRLGVRPRYLHHPDRVAGAKGFRLSLAEGLKIYRDASSLIDFALPPYVIDLPDGSGKTEVSRLSIIETRNLGKEIERRYLWTRPLEWPGIGRAKTASWWDIPEK